MDVHTRWMNEPVPTPVLAVDRVDRVPVANPAGTAEILQATPAPTEFEVASVKAVEFGGRGGGVQFQPGGRVGIAG